MASAKAAAAHPDKSAFSDDLSKGKIQQAAIQPNQPNIQITVNVPSFRLTLWQNGAEVQSYEVGVAQKDFPIDIGDRKVGIQDGGDLLGYTGIRTGIGQHRRVVHQPRRG